MIKLCEVKTPKIETELIPVFLSDETMLQRKNNVLAKMNEAGFDSLLIYADLEHGGNFEYLVGFLPRFEEALLVLHKNGVAYLVLGNENLNKASKARIAVTPVHMPHFSLPNQPMETSKSVIEILKETALEDSKRIGFVGWKKFTSRYDNNDTLYDLPYFVIEATKQLCPQAKFKNATDLFIGENGVRTINNANEFAHYEFGASLAGVCILKTLDEIVDGKSEMEVAQHLDMYGQSHNVVSIMAAGARFEMANMYPSAKLIKKGDPISITTGYKGGLQSRGGYVVACKEDLPVLQQDYLEKLAIPYYEAVKVWLESIHAEMKAVDLYNKIEEVFPKEIYGWSLNPGHLCGDEEWLASPIYPESKETLRSGMLLQIDIIPSVTGYAGISCESGIFLADEKLRNDIKHEYPNVWQRIQKRRDYLINELGIHLGEDVLPTSSATAYCRPFFLAKEKALKNL